LLLQGRLIGTAKAGEQVVVNRECVRMPIELTERNPLVDQRPSYLPLQGRFLRVPEAGEDGVVDRDR
jgi:hypothetical protein